MPWPLQHKMEIAGAICVFLIAAASANGIPWYRSGMFIDVRGEVHRSEARLVDPSIARSDEHAAFRRFSFKTNRSVEVHAGGVPWHFEELEGYVPDKFGESLVLRISSLVSREATKKLLELSRTLLLYEDDPDTVDQRPTFEAPLFRDGLPLASAQYINMLSRTIERRVLPYVRERFNCSSCVACTSIVRRYLQGERREHPWHYDSDAYVTLVMPLTAAADYHGGLYVQPTFDRKDREFIELEAGDAVLHSFDVLHGVEVLSGERISLIIWIKSDSDACKRKLSPWYADSADRGNPAAQYNLGRVVANGLGGTPEDKVAGTRWYTKAAKQGHVMAMYNLAVCLHHGRGVPSDEAAAVSWYAQAAHAGHPLAMTNYGYMQLFGKGMREKNVTGAAFWFQKAALQGVVVAMFQLSYLLEDGIGIRANLSEATYWLEQAASQGHADSKVALLRLRVKSSL